MHAPSQQTPSTQKFDEQSDATVQAWPFGFLPHELPAMVAVQTFGATQPLLLPVVHDFAQAAPLHA